jgi:S-adenosylmethionine synthetase
MGYPRLTWPSNLTEFHMEASPKTALITGATGLLGRQVVKAFQRAGWNVVGTGFSRAKAPDILKVNLDNEDEVSKLLDEVK